MRTKFFHRAAHFAPALMIALLVTACETRDNKDLSTAPPDQPTGDASMLMPSASTVVGSTLGSALAGLTAAEQARFEAGLEEFSTAEEVDEGLGPVFNEEACNVCHDAPVGGTTGRLETRFGRSRNGNFDPLANLGGSLIQDHAIGRVPTNRGFFFKFVPEFVPRIANVTTSRLTTPLFGLGLVDAVPDQTLLALANAEAHNSPRTKGTPHMVVDAGTGATRVGRFGWKAQQATLHTFAGDAYLNEMGITSPDFPDENCPQGNCDILKFNPLPTLNDDGEGVTEFADFMTMLAPPPRGRNTQDVQQGAKVFMAIGCADCHTPSLTTGPSPISALSNKTFQPFSDFLLHNMGRLGDGIVQGNATGREMRTAPLWGLTSRPVFLHDGRAKTPTAAILFHDGQGAQARQNFLRLRGSQQQDLLAFLRSL
jgi:CxxC motif-containing protein (DUF1111 family)